MGDFFCLFCSFSAKMADILEIVKNGVLMDETILFFAEYMTFIQKLQNSHNICKKILIFGTFFKSGWNFSIPKIWTFRDYCVLNYDFFFTNKDSFARFVKLAIFLQR